MYEYKVMSSNSPANEKNLDELAFEGWELVTILHMVEVKDLVYLTYLRRERKLQ